MNVQWQVNAKARPSRDFADGRGGLKRTDCRREQFVATPIGVTDQRRRTRRFDDLDRTPEIIASYFQDAMRQLWTLPVA